MQEALFDPNEFAEFYSDLDIYTRNLVDNAIKYGLAYQAFSAPIYEEMVALELPIDLITDEIERQLFEMPSHRRH